MNLTVASSWLWHPLHGDGYQFWSGIGSDIGELTIVVSILIVAWRVWHHLQCHTDSCRRIGLHRVEGTPYRTCWHHHPVLSQYEHSSVSLSRIHSAHRKANTPDGVQRVDDVGDAK